jgi:transcription elongation factor S-II
MEGTIPCDQIPLLSAYDIFPENWKDIIENKMKRDKLKYELKPEAMTDMFKCRKCSSRSCSYYEMQTRSADEPMTQFITCLDCGNHWRQ